MCVVVVVVVVVGGGGGGHASMFACGWGSACVYYVCVVVGSWVLCVCVSVCGRGGGGALVDVFVCVGGEGGGGGCIGRYVCVCVGGGGGGECIGRCVCVGGCGGGGGVHWSISVCVCVCVEGGGGGVALFDIMCVCGGGGCIGRCVCVWGGGGGCIGRYLCVCQSSVLSGYPSKCRVCIGNDLGRFMPMYSVWCRPGVHWWSIHMASPVVWIRQLSGACLDLSHSDLVRYRCYKRKSVGAHPVNLQICVLLLRGGYTWYMVHGTWYMVGGGGGGRA